MAEFELELDGHKEVLRCYVADIEYDITLGRTWHNRHEPTKKYEEGVVYLRDAKCNDHFVGKRPLVGKKFPMIRGKLPAPEPIVNVGAERAGTRHDNDEKKKITIEEVGPRAFAMFARRNGALVDAIYINPSECQQAKSPADPFTAYALLAHSMTTRPVRTDNAAFACAMYVHESVAEVIDRSGTGSRLRLFGHAMTAEDRKIFMEGKDKDQDPKEKLPSAYHRWEHVFSRHAADELPPLRPGIDHEIKLKGEKQPPYRRPYNMSASENEVIKKWIDEQLEKGNIQKSNSPAASPVLVVRKPSGGLRVCVDYRALNELTVKSRYPIPLVNETLNKISGKKWFTKLDVIAAFNRIRIAQGDEWKTAFTTRYGQFECVVMPFGLCNAPGSFQSYVNDTLREFLDDFVSAYLDDLLIFSDTYEEHVQHVQKVLEKMSAAGLQLDIDKCEFHVRETKYLGLIIGADGIKMDAVKVKAVQEWAVPKTVKDIQSFLGFANFYRRFIKDFSRIVKPMVRLTRTKDPSVVWDWNQACQDAFDGLKKAFTEAPVLAYFTPGLETILETDASDYVTSAVLSQRGTDGILRPIAYLSTKMDPAECNYDIYDKELMAIVKAFEEWRPELMNAEFDDDELTEATRPTLVYSDHKNLEHFMTTKQLNRRQARWAEFLSQFNFKVVYRPGAQGTKPDAFTRRSQDLPSDENDPRVLAMNKTLLGGERILYSSMNIQAPTKIDLRSSANTISGQPALDDQIRKLYSEDEDVLTAVEQLERDLPCPYLKRHKIGQQAIAANGLLYVRNRYGDYCLFIPAGPESTVRTQVIQSVHSTPSAGHPGRAKTLDLLLRNYIWPGMSQSVKKFIRKCRTCRRTKPSHDQYQGLLSPMPVPFQLWDDIAMDFIVELPPCSSRLDKQVYKNMLTVTDRLGKGKHVIPVLSMEAEHIAYVFLKYVYCHHGLPLTITSDRGSQWVSAFWKRLCELLQIDRTMSSAYHPETDGQSEITNKAVEQYLRAFVNYMQDDWVDWCPMAEFALNDHPSETTQVSPFYAETGRNPRSTAVDFTKPREIQALGPAKARVDARTAEEFAKRMEGLRQWLRDNMQLAQATYTDNANRNRSLAPTYKEGDLVYVSTKNWKTARPSKKLDDKWAGPYPILEVLPANTYRLDFGPDSAHVHLANAFHANLLRAEADDAMPGQELPPPPPIEVEREDGVRENGHYEIDKIVDSEMRMPRGRAPRGGKVPQLWFKVLWVGYGADEATWVKSDDIVETAAASIADFHHNCPTKSIPVDFRPPADWIPNEVVTLPAPNAQSTTQAAPADSTAVTPTEVPPLQANSSSTRTPSGLPLTEKTHLGQDRGLSPVPTSIQVTVDAEECCDKRYCAGWPRLGTDDARDATGAVAEAETSSVAGNTKATFNEASAKVSAKVPKHRGVDTTQVAGHWLENEDVALLQALRDAGYSTRLKGMSQKALRKHNGQSPQGTERFGEGVVSQAKLDTCRLHRTFTCRTPSGTSQIGRSPACSCI